MGLRAVVLLLFPALAAVGQPSFFRDTEVKVVGEVQYGQTTDRLQYDAHPRYYAVHFDGKSGDKIDIKVTSINGQAMAALTTSDYKPVVSTFASHIAAVLPPSAEPYPNRYFIVVQEERQNPATFTITLSKIGSDSAAATDYLACKVDSDCVAVPKEGCCHDGLKDAVNKNAIDAYRTANACKLKNPICPQFIMNDKRVARCNVSTRQCEMVQPQPAAP